MQRLEAEPCYRSPEGLKEVRKEARFTVNANQVEEVRDLLGTIFERQPYSGQRVQTIYYATREFNFPRNGYIRERRY